MEVRRAVLGDEHVDRAGPTRPTSPARSSDYITESRVGLGVDPPRPGPPDPQRDHAGRTDGAASATTSCRCTSAPRSATGCPPAEIAEVLLHTPVYTGAPAANAAYAIAEKTLASDRGEAKD